MEKSTSTQAIINNDFYESLQEKWYTANDHPIALLRSENALRARWVSHEIKRMLGKGAKILDLGCGAGFLSNDLSADGFDVTGIDLSRNSLKVAKHYDKTQRVNYLYGDVYAPPFEDSTFDVVCAMDILEHVENPSLLIQQASRVLRHGGVFFFHTFNRNLFSNLIVIKGVDWFVKNAPPHMHVYELFIKPAELEMMCREYALQPKYFTGLAPCFWSFSFWKMLFTREVPKDFRFVFVKSLSTGYCGYAMKE
jgi:2-polyprenyl-6-hydroxyphenyl methylase/3-demethylubiquinone-9 3-methyltransferase